MKEIILASASERRAQILSDCKIPYRVVLSGAEEDIGEGKSIAEVVQLNAIRKAEKVATECEKSIVIGADTLVIHEENIIGKPEDENEAKEMLKNFSGSDLEVYTGLCVIDSSSGKKAAGFEKSALSVVGIKENDLDRYFKLLSPYDKAGGFSIEGIGSLLFDNIRGSYFNILGLPMIKLGELFSEIGDDILNYVS